MGERQLVLILRAVAVLSICALFAAMMPLSWMDWAHRQLGLGPIPTAPVFEYLARSISLLYAGTGIPLWLMTWDVARYRPLIVYAGAAHVVFGVWMLGIDFCAGLPWFWTAMEGPGAIVLGAAIVWLARRNKNSCTDEIHAAIGGGEDTMTFVSKA